LLLVGHGPLWDVLRAQAAALGIADSTLFTGARSDVADLYQVMDLFVLSSLWEGLPTVVIESMAGHVPVVATDISGTRELIEPGRTGWLVPPDDSQALASAIQAALADPLARANCVAAAAEEVVPRFRFERVLASYEQLYTELLGQ
jgi:glycosyltransferase involved in cell wall biosynthesis